MSFSEERFCLAGAEAMVFPVTGDGERFRPSLYVYGRINGSILRGFLTREMAVKHFLILGGVLIPQFESTDSFVDGQWCWFSGIPLSFTLRIKRRCC